MGLTIYAKGMKETYNAGYGGYFYFRIEVAKAFDIEYGNIIEEWMKSMKPLTQEMCDKLEEIITKKGLVEQEEGIWCFISHSDCDGKFSPKECRKIYYAIKDLKCDVTSTNYEREKEYNVLERFKSMFYHCYKRRVNMYYR